MRAAQQVTAAYVPNFTVLLRLLLMLLHSHLGD